MHRDRGAPSGPVLPRSHSVCPPPRPPAPPSRSPRSPTPGCGPGTRSRCTPTSCPAVASVSPWWAAEPPGSWPWPTRSSVSVAATARRTPSPPRSSRTDAGTTACWRSAVPVPRPRSWRSWTGSRAPPRPGRSPPTRKPPSCGPPTVSPCSTSRTRSRWCRRASPPPRWRCCAPTWRRPGRCRPMCSRSSGRRPTPRSQVVPATGGFELRAQELLRPRRCLGRPGHR